LNETVYMLSSLEKTITEIAKETFFLEAKMPVICIDIIRIGIYILIS